jgi:hypothetical protein
MWQDLKEIDPAIRINSNSTTWRVSPMHFRAENGWLKPGNASLAPAWHQQGHEVSDCGT